MLAGKRGVVMGVANKHSIAWSIAKAAHSAGAEVVLTHQGGRFASRAEELAKSLGDTVQTVECDVAQDASIEAAFAQITGPIDFLVHAIAYADRNALAGDFSAVTREQFVQAMDISCYSLIAVSKAAAPKMTNGGSIVTLSYNGSDRIVPGFYNTMGVAKAALEVSMRYLACELGAQNIRVNALAAGTVKTLAATSIPDFDTLFQASARLSFIKKALTADEVAKSAVYLLSDASSAMTGHTLCVDYGAARASLSAKELATFLKGAQ